MIVGLAIGVPSSLAAWLYAVWIDRRLNIPMREAPGASLAELEEIANRTESELPGFFVSLLPIALPVVLITGNTVANTFFPGTAFAEQMVFWGDANLALILSAACGLWLLAKHKGMGLRDLATPAEKAIKDAGLIIMITAGGGAFGGMLVAAGVADSLSEGASEMGISYLALAFGVAMMLRVAQGSATVAMITVDAGALDYAIPAALPSRLSTDRHRRRRHHGRLDERQRLLGLQDDDRPHRNGSAQDQERVAIRDGRDRIPLRLAGHNLLPDGLIARRWER
jgi:H+/gluconate symporter-like permease